MSKIILITGASSGFGALAARALADADGGTASTVYAGMRDTTALAPPDADAKMVSDQIARIVALPEGQRPYRVYIDPADDGSAEVSEVADRIRREFLTRVGLADLLTVAK